MFSKIFMHEIIYWLKKPTFYLYLFTYTGIAFLVFVGSGGLFDGPEPTIVNDARLLNSPTEINYIFQYFNKLFLFLLPTIIGATVYKDFKNNTHSILYSYPIKKSSYLFGKLISSFVIVSFITISVAVSFAIAEHISGLHQSKIGAFSILGYLQVLFVFTIPNMLFIGSIVFSVVVYFRNIYAGFLVIIIFFFFQNISENVFGGSGFLIALFDPFAQNTVLYETQFWTLNDRNTQFIPVLGSVLYNRLLWLAIGLSIFGIVYKKFRFNEAPIVDFSRRKKGTSFIKNNFGNTLNIALPKVTYSYSIKQQIKNSWKLSHSYFISIIKSWMFYIVVFLGILAVLFTIVRITNNNDVTILPTTNLVLTIPAFFFSGIIMLLTFVYSGMLIHRDRNSNINQLVDTTPISNWELLFSKILALIKMQLLLLLTMLFVGITIQIYNGYYNFEIDLYLFNLFTIQFTGLLVWALTSIFIHTLIKNTYLGIFALVLLWFGISGIKEIGVQTKLLLFNFSEPILYSDINGYGNDLLGLFIVKGYWFSFALLLISLTYTLWLRGFPENFKERLFQISSRFKKSKGIKVFTSISLIAFLTFGFTIYNGENTSESIAAINQNDALKKFRKDFDAYKNIKVQPKISDVSISLDIYPSKNSFVAKGTYVLVNTSSQNIDTLLIKTGFDELTKLDLEDDFEVIKKDDYFQFTVIKLKKVLFPNDSLTLTFDIHNKANTLFERNSNVLNNGTFLRKDILPRIGWFLDQTIKHPSNPEAKENQLGITDADYINFEATISTSKNQMAIAPGYLQKTWIENGRNYYSYKSPQKIKFSLAFISSEFDVKKENYKGVSLEIYHHKNHSHNISKMMDGLKASFDYNNKFFGNYAYKNVKVIEFPMTEGVFATIMGNIIPTSERRFISNNNISAEEQFKPAFKVQAHELTHHWWGNQLVHANALGAAMLSESITDYITLKTYESKYGKQQALDFLKLQRRRYIRGRISQVNEESPLYLAKTQDIYLSYGKGSIAFNTISHYMGEKKLNTLLKRFLNTHKLSVGNYPTSLDLMSKIKEAIPDSLQYLVKDYFEDIIFHNAKINAFQLLSANENGFTIEIDFDFSKHQRNDTKNVITPNDYVEIGFYNENDKLFETKIIRVTEINNKETFTLSKKPSKVVIDPNYLLIDKNLQDNEKGL